MATDIFLKLDGIKGESKDFKHKDEIDIDSFSWGLNQTGSMGSGGGGGTGKVSVHDITITKSQDKSSCDLKLVCCNGKHITEGLVTFRKAGEKPLEYYTIKLTDIIVTSFNESGSPGQERPLESISLNFGKFQQEYFEQKPDGSGQKAGGMGWDVKANQKV